MAFFDSHILFNPGSFMLCFVYLLYAAFQQTNLKVTSLTYDHFLIAHGSMRAWLGDSSALCGVGGVTQQC